MCLKSSCVSRSRGYFSVRNWRTITCICWRHIVKMFVYLFRYIYIYNFSINVFIKIAGVCSDICRVVHKTKLFVVIMFIYLERLETLSFLFVLLSLCMSYRTPLDDEYLQVKLTPPLHYLVLQNFTKRQLVYVPAAGTRFNVLDRILLKTKRGG